MFKRHYILLIFNIILTVKTASGQSIQLSGTIYDEQSGEPLPGVNIRNLDGNYGTVSNVAGFYQLNITAGSQHLIFSFMGYRTDTVNLQEIRGNKLDYRMVPENIMTEEVVITADAPRQKLVSTVDIHTLSAADMQDIPYLMGEADPVKAVQLLPGVQAAGEGNTGYTVRGGTLDQNLILIDDAPVYNAGHLFGFFSVFNGNVIDKVSMIKGGVPAEYGGRLSSVLDIRTKAGNYEQWKGAGSLGLIAANLQLEGPIVKDRASLMVAGRRTYYDLFTGALQNSSLLKTDLNYFFHDVNIRLETKIGDRHKLSLSGYTGKDFFLYKSKSAFSNDMVWTNKVASAKWHFAISPDWFAETTAYSSRYQMKLQAGIASYHLGIHTAVTENGLKQHFIRYTDKGGEMSFGWLLSQQTFMPNSVNASADGQDLKLQDNIFLHARNAVTYFNYRFGLGKNLKVNTGLRVGYYQHIGPFSSFISQAGQVTDTVSYQKGEKVYNDWYWEPRLALTYQLGESSSLKLSYDLMHQHSHMVPMSSTSLPTDSWVTSSQKVAPQQGTQYSLGYFTYLNSQQYALSAIGFYKQMKGQVEYQNGSLFGYSKGLNYDDNYVFGEGRAAGLEWLLEKKQGKLRGQLAYTLSRTTRKFPDLNGGKTFPAKYDRRHDLSLTGKYLLSPRWTFSSIWVYTSGNTMTLPVGRYMINGNVVNEYNGRNNFRMPAYHRFDLSATYVPIQQHKNYKTSWVFSIYNLYSRMNPYFIYFDVKGNLQKYELKIKAQQVSLFPIIPTLTYRAKF